MSPQPPLARGSTSGCHISEVLLKVLDAQARAEKRQICRPTAKWDEANHGVGGERERVIGEAASSQGGQCDESAVRSVRSEMFTELSGLAAYGYVLGAHVTRGLQGHVARG
eukprot:CAMPEP_0181228840 /NCGR_PEP_ID=MMETSP1096-20121128/33567_1 /TAXON_ID=156174 ORGANISM="Chrysochromulina ericina, Strain CCMP281" /NCGR_SAMPLE_ID=MMETSP1096 /ASSEMBLY_ACC=CAM_ASM_000453 /LENGTH=110 /DNA_ID=CAMNT_0023322401 /DNA_START=339 /DNA_END=668 /DNA_ORIENTATION=-